MTDEEYFDTTSYPAPKKFKGLEDKEKDIRCMGKSIKNTFAAVLLNRLKDAGLTDDNYLAPPGDFYELTKAIGTAGLKELDRPVSKYYLMKTYSDLSNKVDFFTGRTPDVDEVYKWFFPMKADYISEADVKSIIGEDEEITVDSKPSDIRVAHTDYGNFIVSVKGDILGIADKEALERLKVPKDPFIAFSAHENIAVKVDPIEEKVREQMEKESLQEHYCPKASSVTQNAKTGETTYTVNGEKHDPVDHPSHYTSEDLYYIPAECIQVSRLLSFSLGNVIKYIWRMGRKGNAVEDAKKACWYLDDAFKTEVETRNEQEALGILSVLGGNDIVDNMKIVLMQDIINGFLDGLHMDRDKEIHNRIMNLAQSIKD